MACRGFPQPLIHLGRRGGQAGESSRLRIDGPPPLDVTCLGGLPDQCAAHSSPTASAGALSQPDVG